VDEILHFGTIVLVVAGGFLLALALIKLTERFPLPNPALFLLIGALISVPEVYQHLPIKTAERIGVVALVLILFDGGMHVGWRRFRRSAFPIASLGIVGTFLTAAVVALVAHYLFDFGWTLAWIVGAAVAPTDPAVMFSVLGNREIGGRSGTILEGESGANDPVGIALMISILDYATSSHGGSLWSGVADFVISMAVGLAVGIAGALVLMTLMRSVSLPGEGLYPIRTLIFAFVIYGLATVAHGSGFLAVFVAGLMVSDVRAPFKGEIENFHKSLASLSEIAVFAVLGLTTHFTDLTPTSVWLDGLLIALLLAFVIRPVVIAPLLAVVRLRLGERLFIMWGGLKGAVPILLGILVLLEGVHGASRVYGIIFVVVAFSVVIQGSTMSLVAHRLAVPMRSVVPTPWDVSIRLKTEPRTVRRYNVVRGSRALGKPISDLPLGDRSWISMLIREGEPEQPRGSTELLPGDELLVMAEPEDEQKLAHLFERKR
jgi:potassium/hydrogen antiporter